MGREMEIERVEEKGWKEIRFFLEQPRISFNRIPSYMSKQMETNRQTRRK
jgi:hypothetical protein